MTETKAPRVLLVQHTANHEVEFHWKRVLDDALRTEARPVSIDEVEVGPYDIVVLLGVSDNLDRAAEAVRKLTERFPEVPIVVITRHKEPANVARFSYPGVTVLTPTGEEERFLDERIFLSTLATLTAER